MALCTLGINLLGARNSALQNLVTEIPPSVVVNLLGYTTTAPSDMPNWRPNHGHATSPSGHDRIMTALIARRIGPSRIRRFTGT
jgi:hypothetical protein